MKKLINESVNRFLGWKLPANFAPDAGIMFKPNANTESPVQFQYKHEPTGTNLFRAGQAEAMLIHVAKPLTDKIETLESDLQLQTKVFIAACEDLALIAEKLGIDPEDGGASPIIGSITELEAQLTDAKKDAERYQALRRGQKWSVIDGIGDTLRAEGLDEAIDDAAIAEGKQA